MTTVVIDRPTKDKVASTYDELWRIVSHPAFRLGFLDARAGLPHNHDRIAARIIAETPAGALKRLGYESDLFTGAADANLAQYRYEEGRLAFVQLGLRCKAWGHPDYPPAAIRTYIDARTTEVAST